MYQEEIIQWRCDYCYIAAFDTYEEASEHERTCAARFNGGVINVIYDEEVDVDGVDEGVGVDKEGMEEEGVDANEEGMEDNEGMANVERFEEGAAMDAEEPVVETDTVPEKSEGAAGKAEERPALQSDETEANDTMKDMAEKQKTTQGENAKGQLWGCDFCQQFFSYDFDKVARHEEGCMNNGAAEEKVAADGNEEDEMSDEGGDKDGNMSSERGGIGEEVDDKSSTEQDENMDKGGDNNSATDSRAESPSTKKRTRWRCDVCQVAVFDTYNEAVEHENNCAGSEVGGNKRQKSGEGSDVDCVEVAAVATKVTDSHSSMEMDANDMSIEPVETVVESRNEQMSGVAMQKSAAMEEKIEKPEVKAVESSKSSVTQGNVTMNMLSVALIEQLQQESVSVAQPVSLNVPNIANEEPVVKVTSVAQSNMLATKESQPDPEPTAPMDSKSKAKPTLDHSVGLSTNTKTLSSEHVATSPQKMQSNLDPPLSDQLVDWLTNTSSEMAQETTASNKVSGIDAPQFTDWKTEEPKTIPVPSFANEELNQEETPPSEKQSILWQLLSILSKSFILLTPLAIAMAYLPQHLTDNLFTSITTPSITLAASPLLLLITAYALFSLTLMLTNQTTHHSQNYITDILIALRDTIFPPKVEYLSEPCPTLREYIQQGEFHMAFAPAFFGFFAYFGALAALEEETGLIVPRVKQQHGDKIDNGNDNTSGLKSVAGASAGAMAAVMLGAGIHPRRAAEYVCTFNWSMVADPLGMGGLVKGNKFEEFMREFIRENAVRLNREENVMLEDALVPVGVSGFDLLRMRGVVLSKGCMAKAARASAGFPGLFQPVSWNDSESASCVEDGTQRKWFNWLRVPDMLLIDGGIRDGLGLNGLSAYDCSSSSTSKGMRVINMVVGDFGITGSNGMKDLPRDVEAESLVSISIKNTPMCGPWAMANGPKAVESARKAMVSMLDSPMERGAGDNHYVLRVDASKWVD